MLNILIIIFIVLLIFWALKKNEYFTDMNYKIKFFNKDDTITFFINDVDDYLKNLNSYDIKALDSSSHNDYLQKSIKDAKNFTEAEKQKLISACKEADNFFRTKLNIKHVDNNILANMPWTLAKTSGKYYEEGYPHTRNDIIFITDDVIKSPLKYLIRVLIHEKVHVYSRLYPDLMQEWNTYHGFKRYKPLKNYKYVRSNPDLDNWIYTDKFGKELLASFKNENPTGIDDATYSYNNHDGYMAEAPNEILAYYIDYTYANEKFPYLFLLNTST
jgi:hypothetical protein